MRCSMWTSCGTVCPSSTMILRVQWVNIWWPSSIRAGTAGVKMAMACRTMARASIVWAFSKLWKTWESKGNTLVTFPAQVMLQIRISFFNGPFNYCISLTIHLYHIDGILLSSQTSTYSLHFKYSTVLFYYLHLSCFSIFKFVIFLILHLSVIISFQSLFCINAFFIFFTNLPCFISILNSTHAALSFCSLRFSSPAGQSSCEWRTLQWCAPGVNGHCIYRQGPRRLWAAGMARRRSWGAAACCCVTCCCHECGGVRAPPAGWRTAAGRFAASPAGQPASLGQEPSTDIQQFFTYWKALRKRELPIQNTNHHQNSLKRGTEGEESTQREEGAWGNEF